MAEIKFSARGGEASMTLDGIELASAACRLGLSFEPGRPGRLSIELGYATQVSVDVPVVAFTADLHVDDATRRLLLAMAPPAESPEAGA